MKRLITLLAVALLSCPGLSLAGTSVKSSGSNSDNRTGNAQGENTAGGAERATSVRSGKSNSDNRVNPGDTGNGVDAATTVKSGKSNSDN